MVRRVPLPYEQPPNDTRGPDGMTLNVTIPEITTKPLTRSLSAQGVAAMVAAVLVPIALRRLGIAVPEDVQAALITLAGGVILLGFRRALGGIAAVLLFLAMGCANYPDLRPTLPRLDRALQIAEGDSTPEGAALIDSSTPAQRAELRANRLALYRQARATIAAAIGSEAAR